MSVTAIAGLAAPLIGDIISLFKKVDANEIPLKEAEAKLQEVVNNRMAIIADLLKGQMDINKIEAEAGRLGWRNWLCVGLTAAFLFGTLGLPIIESLAALLIFAGVDPITIKAFKAALPLFPYEMIFTMLSGLLGLYTARGYEKTKYAKIGAGLNKEVLFDELRKGYGSLSQPHVDMINKAIKKAGQ